MPIRARTQKSMLLPAAAPASGSASRSGSRSRRTSTSDAGTFELVVFTVGKAHYAVARGGVRAIRPSPRVRSSLGVSAAATGLPLVSLSSVLGIDRDTSVDRRVIEVVHWGERLGLEVTAIAGIRRVKPDALMPLPVVIARSVRSRHVLGVVQFADRRDDVTGETRPGMHLHRASN